MNYKEWHDSALSANGMRAFQDTQPMLDARPGEHMVSAGDLERYKPLVFQETPGMPMAVLIAIFLSFMIVLSVGGICWLLIMALS